MAVRMANPARYAPDLLGFYPQERQIDRRYEMTGVNPYAMNADRYVSGLLTDPMARAEFGTGLLQGATTDLGGTPVDVYAGAVDVAQAITPQNNQFNYYTNPFWMLSQSGDIAQKAQSVAGSEALGEAVYGKPEQGYEMYRDPARLIGGVTGAGELALGKVSKEVAPYVARGVNYLTDAMPRPQAVTPEGLLMDVPQQAPTQPQTLLMEGDNVPSATQTVDNVPIAEPAQVVPPTDENPVGIIAFHGSGADFDEFKLEKIGTGEGAQAYGYGLYFTDSEDIAKFYRNTVSKRAGRNITYDGKEVPRLRDRPETEQVSIVNQILSDLADENQFFDQPIDVAYNGKKQRIADSIREYEARIDAGEADDLELLLLSSLRRSQEALDQIDVNKFGRTGKVYKVALDPKPEELLDYDKPIGEQTPEIQAKLKELIDNELTEDDAMNLGYEGMEINQARANMLNENRSVVSFLNDWAVFRGYDSAAEELLNKYDIKGIKYFSNSSRNTSGGELIDIIQDADGYRAKVAVDNRQGGLGGSGRIVTTSAPYKTEQEALDWANRNIDNKERNYVIFDDKLIKIMEKYGIPAGVSVTAVKGAMQDTDDGLLAKDGQQPQGLL